VEISGINVQALDYLRTFSSLPVEIAATVSTVLASPLYQAYDKLQNVASQLTGYLEASMNVINITTIPFGNNPMEYKNGFNGGVIVILEGVSSFMPIDVIATGLSEELFHGAIRTGTGCFDKFAANEAFAKSMAYNVANKLGCLEQTYMFGDLSYFGTNINPSMDSVTLNENLKNASQKLYNDSNGGYGEGFWFWRGPMRPWSNSDREGADFLNVAEAVWIN